jgi:hypothetical protein
MNNVEFDGHLFEALRLNWTRLMASIAPQWDLCYSKYGSKSLDITQFNQYNNLGNIIDRTPIIDD